MKCPVCSKEMVPENFGINVDVCENGCKGIWLDHDELQNLDENNEGLGEALRKEVNIDECYNCGGFFLDSGELKEIRDTYMSDQEVHDYMQKLINGIPEYQKEQADLKKLERREEAINRFTKFLRISYWLGKGKDNAN
jgi:Zn-finger nucleic acid-binding protein